MNFQDFIPLVGFPILRSVAGWAENALKDGKVTKFEFKQLGETIVRVGFIAVAGYFGLQEMGVDVTAIGAGAGSVVIDLILSAMKKKK